jgi:hypothetical protein
MRVDELTENVDVAVVDVHDGIGCIVILHSGTLVSWKVSKLD